MPAGAALTPLKVGLASNDINIAPPEPLHGSENNRFATLQQPVPADPIKKTIKKSAMKMLRRPNPKSPSFCPMDEAQRTPAITELIHSASARTSPKVWQFQLEKRY
jgi:hypothetical protein